MNDLIKYSDTSQGPIYEICKYLSFFDIINLFCAYEISIVLTHVRYAIKYIVNLVLILIIW